MRNLKVTNFSSIASADITFYPLTVIIGPQASGKSVLCKLSYFFLSLLQEAGRAISEGAELDAFKDIIRDKFVRWFPVGTWGTHKFEIAFRTSGYEIRVVRSGYAGQVSDKIRITLSDPFLENYENLSSRLAKNLRNNRESEESLDARLPLWEAQEVVRQSLRHLMGKDYVGSQLFVPAGRSFFTSIGRAIAVFENSDSIDPLTLDFGRLFAARLDRDIYYGPGNKAITTYIQRVTNELLKGEMIREREKDYLKTTDGRRIPLGALSSGQQELLPLLRVLPRNVYPYKQVYYIEEPEAHLFPDAQSRLIDVLSTVMNLCKGSVDLVLTTHSPYVLTKFNNLIEAGSLGRSEKLKERVGQIIKPDSWIRKNQLAAYAICDGTLKNVTDEHGLINGDYLDTVSNTISDEFSRLLGVQFGN
jgi:hypothetical protein